MSVVTGTYVRLNQSTNTRVNYIIDNMVTPNILEYRQINIYHEPGIRTSPTSWKFTYQNWNPDFVPQVFMNGSPDPLGVSYYSINRDYGIITIPTADANDNILCSYNFDYFSLHTLESFVTRAIGYINTGAVGPTTDYDVTNAPTNWDGIISDMVIIYAMEKMIFEYDLWKGKLIFAIAPQGLIDGNDNVIAQLESVKNSTWDRVQKVLDNEKFKRNEFTAPPTEVYYRAIQFGSGTRSPGHGIARMGKLRGFRSNKYGGV